MSPGNSAPIVIYCSYSHLPQHLHASVQLGILLNLQRTYCLYTRVEGKKHVSKLEKGGNMYTREHLITDTAET